MTTHRHAAVTLYALGAILLASLLVTLGTTAAADPTPAPCLEALDLGHELGEAHGRVVGTQAAYAIALDMGLDKAPRIRAHLRELQQAYADTTAAYNAAADRCRAA